MTQKTLLIAQLKSAYALEMAVIPILESQAKTCRNYLRIYKHVKDLLLEAKRQAKNTKYYLMQLQGRNSAKKEVDSGPSGIFVG